MHYCFSFYFYLLCLAYCKSCTLHTYLYSSQNDKTPLLCAAEAGHDEVVAYLLQFKKVRTDLRNQPGKVYSASVSHITWICTMVACQY